MLQAIEIFVNREEKREAWRKEGITAWEEYQRTELHLSNDGVKEWLCQTGICFCEGKVQYDFALVAKEEALLMLCE